MSTVSVTQLTNGTTADATAVNADLNALANTINGGLDATNITPASLDNSVFLPAYDPVTRLKETTSNFVVSGLTIPTSGTLSTTIALGIAYVSGKRLSVSAFPITFAASKDTYVDLKSDGTYATVAVNNGATTGMPLTTNADGTNSLRIAKVVTSASAVTAVFQATFDSTNTYYGQDPIGNPIYRRSPLRHTTISEMSADTGSLSPAAFADITNVPAITKIISGNEVEVEFTASVQPSAGAVDIAFGIAIDGVIQNSSIDRFRGVSNVDIKPLTARYKGPITAGSHVFKPQAIQAGGSFTVFGSRTGASAFGNARGTLTVTDLL